MTDSITNVQSRVPHAFLFFWAFLSAIVSQAQAEIHSIRSNGMTLIEGESFSAASPEFPRVELCRKCSGGQNLGFFWRDSWFEIQVSVPRDGDYWLTARASSEKGTSINVVQRSTDDQESVELGVVEVPKTRQWTRYIITEAVPISLTAGTHTLRFQSVVDGGNVDYLTFSAIPSEKVVSFKPPKNAGPDKNPLKGFGSGWWRPDDDYATVGFQYLEWGQFEPQDDQFNFQYVEEVLDRVGTRGRHLILQFVVDWDYYEPVEKNYLGPDWLLKKVGEHRGHATPGDKSSRPMRATKYNHPVYVQEATEAITALTEYFRDDPRVFILQAGLLGFWSEWHTFPRQDWNPSDDTKQKLLDAYLRNIPTGCFTQIRYPDEAAIDPRSGIGYSNGSATPTNHGYDFGKMVGQKELWKNGPITGEWPPNVERDYWQRFFLTDEGERFIHQARYSTLLMPESKEIKEQLPSWTPEDKFLSMHRQLGYNVQVDQIQHVVNKAGELRFELSINNSGIAPFYCDWEVQLGILDADGKVVDFVEVEIDLRQLAPGSSVKCKGSTAKKIQRDKRYQIGLRIMQPGADEDKSQPWKLDPRNVYVVLANDVGTIEGSWGKDHELIGGWNLLGHVVMYPALTPFDSSSFPFAGSVRPVGEDR